MDKLLLSKCLAGNQQAWSQFVQCYTKIVYAAVSQVLRTHAPNKHQSLIEDLTQDVFVKLIANDFRLLRAFDPTRASLTTYLTVIAHSTAYDALRRKEIHTIPLDANDPTQQDSSIPTERPKIPADLLSPRQRIVLTMYFDKQMETDEIARVLGISNQTARSTKHKALNKLREYFQPPHND